ncbi:MAG: cytochrome c oxidase subunit 4, partial [Curtobacterium sp.]
IEDGDAELGHFSPWSWWPILLAASTSICFLGVAAGLWIVPIGLALVAVTLVGWVFEYYRGNFGH